VASTPLDRDPIMQNLSDRARAWLADDPDPATRAQLSRLLDDTSQQAVAELADAFAGELQFGTAGLRGQLGAGPNRMNRAVVLRAAAGLVSFLRDRGGQAIVVGYDARHRSADFARDTARVASAAGLRAVLLPRPLPTPVLAYAVRALGVDAGVMVTASHNPAPDNGYKVYLGDGRQLVSPDDEAIAAAMASVGAVLSIPADDRLVETPDVDGGLLGDYITRVAGLVGPTGPGRAGLRVVGTSVHGVGGPVFDAVSTAAGFLAPVQVPAQARPDPDFPTTPFPNPEEPGVLDLAIGLARETSADLVIAQDPDADRCAVAVPDPQVGWRRLTGDEVGVLLAWRILDESNALTGPDRARSVFARTIVSATWIDALAEAHGIAVHRTLTGFKWLSRVPGLRYAYEEALGYCVDPDAVADKDGISAGLLIMDLGARLAARGATLCTALDELTRRHGIFCATQRSIRVRELAERDTALTRLRAAAPDRLAGMNVTATDDLAEPRDGLPPTPGLRLWLAAPDGSRGWVVVRPSGTERKLKCYLEVSAPPPGDTDLQTARAAVARHLADTADDLVGILTPPTT